MAVVVFLVEESSTVFLLAVIGMFFFLIIKNGNRNEEALFAAAYMTGAEVFFRMTGGAVFYELGKYSVILFILTGMTYRGNSTRAIPYWLYLLFLIPGVVVAAINLNFTTDFRDAIAFNLSGPLCLAFSALYCYYREISFSKFKKVLIVLLLPIITTAFYAFLYTPDVSEVLHSGTQSNFAASGGFGPNQVSAVLGLGAFILFTRLFTVQSKLTNLIDLCLMIFLSYRAVITFSRGGVITALACIVAFLLVYFFTAKPKAIKRALPKLAVIVGSLMFMWIFSSIQTMGLIDKRYSNKDAAGRLKQDITTGRAELISSELIAFYEQPLLGIGVGKIKEFRYERLDIEAASHNEVSRLLSEHGLLGVICLIILIFTPIIYFFSMGKKNPFLLAFLIWWFLTINHSSMRIAAPAFIYGLALLYIHNEKDNLYRK